MMKNQAGRSNLAARRSRAMASRLRKKDAGVVLGMMAMSGVDGDFGPMAPSTFKNQSGGRSSLASKVGTLQSTFKSVSGLAIEGDVSSGEFDEIL